jgi:hypothetical protein
MDNDPDRKMLVRALRAVEPALRDIVLVGGWAQRLHAHHPLAAADARALHTVDADLFVPKPSSNNAIRNESLRNAGFEIRPSGDESPPTTRYALSHEGHKLDLDFLAHRAGASRDRRDRSCATIHVGEAVAQRLPFMEVMSHETWTCVLDEERGYPTGASSLIVQVVGPATYVAHKLMVLEDRQDPQSWRRTRSRAPHGGDDDYRTKQERDVRYLYESIRRFAPALSQLRECWMRRTTSPGERRRLNNGRRLLQKFVPGAAAARDLDGRTADPQRLRDVLDLGLAEIFGPLPR